MSDITEKFAANVKSLRIRRGISQADIARYASRAQSRVSEVESGTHDPRLSTVLAVVTAAGGELMAIPREYVAAVNEILSPAPLRQDPGSAFDDVFVEIPRTEEVDEVTDAPKP